MKECKPECRFILHQGDLNASSLQKYLMEGKGKECKPECRFILPQGDPNASSSQSLYRQLHTSPGSDAQNVAMAGDARDTFRSNGPSANTQALYREQLHVLMEKCRKLIKKQHVYAGRTKGARICRVQEALIFDGKLEKQWSLVTDSFKEIECRREQNRSNNTNPVQVEMGIGEAELQLEDEQQMIEEDHHTFQERLLMYSYVISVVLFCY